jgi:hypothetical protein
MGPYQMNSAGAQVFARRLRYLRRFPPDFCGRVMSQDQRESAALAYEYALRVFIDELGAAEDFYALFYGPQNEDPDRGYPE